MIPWTDNLKGFFGIQVSYFNYIQQILKTKQTHFKNWISEEEFGVWASQLRISMSTLFAQGKLKRDLFSHQRLKVTQSSR